MTFFSFHGVTEQERKVGNTFVVDLKIGGDYSVACKSDNIDDAINYASIYEEVKKVMETPCNLLEHLAEKICISLKNKFLQILSIEIKVTKINPPIEGQTESASILLTR
jgi:dihydroneopterin aldolase